MNVDEPTTAERWMQAVPSANFAAPCSALDWEIQRGQIRSILANLLGDFPPPPQGQVATVHKRWAGDGYTVESLELHNGMGDKVPGYLFLPDKISGKVPAILYCHWHGDQYEMGKQELLESNATPVPPGPALARMGYAVLGIDACCFGERNGRGPDGPQVTGAAGELTAAKFHLLTGRSLWGALLHDDLMALDYLCSRSEVDANRIGVTGMSMGSTRSWWLTALDDRLKTAVCVGCMTRHRDLIQDQMLKAHSIYFFVPGLLRHFDSEAVIACAAPRPMLFMTGDSDPGSPLSGIRTIGENVSAIYRLFGREEAFQGIVYPGVGHAYLPEMWERTLAWFERHLKPDECKTT